MKKFSKIFGMIMCALVLVVSGGFLTACNGKHTCSWETAWQYDETYHWHECEDDKCDKTSEKLEHEWGEGVVTTPATPTSNGVKTYTCECGKTKTEDVVYVSRKTITQEEWRSALSFEDKDNYTYSEATSETLNSPIVRKYKNGVIHYKQIATLSGSVAEEKYFEKTVVDSQTKYYEYGYTTGTWTRKSINTDKYIDELPAITPDIYQYNNFSYDDKTEMYKRESQSFYDHTRTNLCFKFEDGLLTYMSYVKDGVTYVSTFSYNDAYVTLPTVA